MRTPAGLLLFVQDTPPAQNAEGRTNSDTGAFGDFLVGLPTGYDSTNITVTENDSSVSKEAAESRQ